MATIWKFVTVAIVAVLLSSPRPGYAHCDTLDGPVVNAAREALDSGDITPLLIWVHPEAEDELRAVFADALAIRGTNERTREVADRYLFETVVRLHRAGEGVAYSGLLPAGLPLDPGIAAAEEALASGSVEELLDWLLPQVESAVRARFEHAATARTVQTDSVEAGREYVDAYVQFFHFVEALYAMTEDSEVHAGSHEPEQLVHEH
jgi:hypothetical protein